MKILVVQLGRIGDMILVTPIFRAIKEKYPESSLNVLAGRHNAGVIKNNPRLDNVFVYEKTPIEFIKLIRKLRKEKIDFWIDPKDHYSSESKMFARFSKAKNKIGFIRNNEKIFNTGIPKEDENISLHYVERCFNALKELDIELTDDYIPKPELFESQESSQYVEKFLRNIRKEKVITINLSASKEQKMWTNDKWLKVINAIDDNYTIVITTTPEHRNLAEELKQSKPELNIFKSRSMDDVTSLLKNSNLLITPDTSLVHVAAAFDVPLIGLFSGLEAFYKKFHPLSTNYISIKAETGFDGIKIIEPEPVIEAYRKMKEVILIK